jgi:thioredoxin-like negative regulator of GroEL
MSRPKTIVRRSGSGAATLVFVTKSTSGPARRMESLIARIAWREKQRVSVVIVDVDSEPRLAKKLAVSAVPALVLLVGRRAVERLEGPVSGAEIDQMLSRHLSVST